MAWITNERTTVIDNYVSLPNNDPLYEPVIERLKALDAKRDHLDKLMKAEALPVALSESVEGRTAEAEAKILYGNLLARKREGEAAHRNVAAAIIDPPHGPEIRTMYRSLPLSEQVKRLPRMDLAEASALTLYPDLANVAEQLRPMIEDKARLLAHQERTALAASYPKRPSLDGDILATGVDTEALQRAGELALAEHKARLERSKDDDNNMRSIVHHLAGMFGQTPQGVLERVTA